MGLDEFVFYETSYYVRLANTLWTLEEKRYKYVLRILHMCMFCKYFLKEAVRIKIVIDIMTFYFVEIW